MASVHTRLHYRTSGLQISYSILRLFVPYPFYFRIVVAQLRSVLLLPSFPFMPRCPPAGNLGSLGGFISLPRFPIVFALT